MSNTGGANGRSSESHDELSSCGQRDGPEPTAVDTHPASAPPQQQQQQLMVPSPTEVPCQINALATIGPPKLPVDRDWLQKLLHKHAAPNNASSIPAADHRFTKNSPTMKQRNHRIRAYVLAPMVDQSDLPFRLQCRRYGTNLAVTPMIHAKLFATTPTYRQKFLPLANASASSVPIASSPPTPTVTTIPTISDRPLIAQLCGSNVEHMITTALAVAPFVDAIDINCGCPQSIAKRGVYGAFLLEQEDALLTVVRHLLAVLDIPLTVKVRLLPPPEQDDDDEEKDNENDDDDENIDGNRSSTTNNNNTNRDVSLQRSMALYEQLVDAGIHMLTVHGRTRFHKGVGTGPADWDAIRKVVDAFGDRIPIIANGSISNQQDVRDCLDQTNADGVMSSEAILEYPPLFQGMAQADADKANGGSGDEPTSVMNSTNDEPPRIRRLALAQEYLALAKLYPPDQNGQGSGVKCCKVHVHRFLHADLQNPAYSDLRTLLVNATTMEELEQAVEILAQRKQEQQKQPHNNYHNDEFKETKEDDNDECLSWYFRHRGISRDCFGITCNHASGDVPTSLLEARMNHERNVKRVDLIDDAADCFASLFDVEN